MHHSSFITHHSNIAVIIPANNEESSIGLVLRAIPPRLVREVVVANNASTDRTAEIARQHGATVVEQPLKGYGNACLKAIEYFQKIPPPSNRILSFSSTATFRIIPKKCRNCCAQF